MRIHAASGLLLCVLALCLPSCGANDSTASNTGTEAASDGEVATIGKAALIKRGDAICSKADAEQRAALKQYEKENPIKLTTKPAIEATIRKAAFPPIATEIERLEALGSPGDDKSTVDAIISALRDALKASEQDPGTLIGRSGEGSFGVPDKLAAAYGFKACSKAL